jgi:hypothetical protein
MKNGLEVGISNLLHNCAKLQSGETLLIVQEDPALGWYDSTAALAVRSKAQAIGLETTLLEVGAPGLDKDPELLEQIARHDSTIFFARVGDQDRFGDNNGKERSVMVYARDAANLSSPFGQIHHQAMSEMKNAVNDVVLGGTKVTITCPLGTNLSGAVPEVERENDADVTVKRFPLGVPQPVPAAGFSGKVALTGYLTPTGSKPYDPPNCRIDGVVMANVKAGRIVGFEGEADAIVAVERHYDTVSQQLGIDRDFIHSWHAGIHPGSGYPGSVHDDPDRWSNNVFTHPRFVHFHTCGAYAPGEICWMVLDPTIDVDGTALWERGTMKPDNFDETSQVISRWPELRRQFEAPAGPIGLET